VEEEDPKQGVCWPCPCGTDQLVNNRCMGRITSAASSTIRTIGKHLPLPCYSSVSSAQNAANSNATTTGHQFLCCAQTNKAPQRERVLGPIWCGSRSSGFHCVFHCSDTVHRI
jgi:hypothetical protein